MSEQKVISIFYIEDNKDDLDLLTYCLTAEQTPMIRFSIDSALTMESGLSKLEEKGGDKPCDVILLDLNLPDSSGIESLRRIFSRWRDIPVVALTGVFEPGIVGELIQRGAQDVLSKEFFNVPGIISHSITSSIDRKLHLLKLKQLEEQLIQAEKLDFMGRNAAGSAHDLGTPFANIQMGLSMLKTYKGQLNDSYFDDILETMEQACKMGIDITRGMVNFSKSAPFEAQHQPLSETVQNALRLLDFDLRHSHTKVVTDFASSNIKAFIDETKFKQILINLIRNSIRAMKNFEDSNNEIFIRALALTRSAPDLSPGVKNWMEKGDIPEAAVVEIRDTGPGVPPQKLDHIFEPFFTSESKNGGTGLGLSVVKTIIDLHGGFIEPKNMDNPKGLQTSVFLRM